MAASTAPERYAEICAAIHTDLLTFVRRSHPDYLVGDVHRIICRELGQFARDVEAGRSPRLAIFMPPRHGKSVIASERFPAWFVGRNPAWRVIGASYGQDLANTFSRRVRGLLREDWFLDAFPDCRLSQDNTSVQQWETTEGGGYRAAGIGAGITGMGAHVLVIDDPVKDAEDANSPAIREKVWEWYTSTAYTRLAPGGGVLLIQTRWHQDDLAGRILRDDPKGWRVIQFPAIKDGAALHPERYSVEQLEEIRERLGSYYWSALYQQEPIAREDLPFHPDAFNRLDPHHPLSYDYKAHRIGIVLDVAYTADRSADYTALVVGGIDSVGMRRVWVAEERQIAPAQRDAWILSTLREWVPRGVRSISLEAVPDAIQRTTELVRAAGLPVKVESLKHGGRAKASRIEELQGYLQHIEFAPEAEQVIRRLSEWSHVSGTPDDLPDALAYLMAELDKRPTGRREWKPPRPKDPTRARIYDAMYRRPQVEANDPTRW